MRGSGAIGLQLALLLALWGPAEGQTSETTTPSENISERTTGISTPTQPWNSTTLELSSTGPSSTMATSSEAEKLPFLNDTIIIEGFPKVSQTKSITLESPAELELMCSLVISNTTNTAKMETVWKSENATFNPETIRRNETRSKWCTRYTIKVRNEDQMRKYTCVYKTTPEINATFDLQVPQVHVKSERIISYVGDTVVLTCDVGNVNPSFWIWYSNNGSGEVVINSTLMPEKYSFIQTPANTTKLKISALSELDTSSYWCKARFLLGESKGEVSLTVLTYLTPLKPFLVIAAEVIILVSLIFIFEVVTKKKGGNTEVEKEFEQVETLKSEDSNGVENSTTRHRKV